MRMSRGTLVTAAETEAAPGTAIVFIKRKLQPHTVRIIFSAAKAMVLLFSNAWYRDRLWA